MTWSTCRCLPLDPQRKVRGIKVRRALAAQWWRRGGTVWLRRPRLVLRDHTRKTTTCFTKFPPTQVASTLGLARCVVLWMILCHEQRTNYVKMWIFVIVESRVLKLVKGHSHIASENLLVSPLEGKFKTTIFAVVVWQTMNSYHNSRGVVVWLYAMSYHNSRQTSTVVVWIHMCHTTTSGEMTKFSLSTWECYTRTEEKCGLLNFSTRGLAVVVKTNSSTRGCAACGEFVFTTPAKPLVGNLFFPIRGFATHREKSRPQFSSVRV